MCNCPKLLECFFFTESGTAIAQQGSFEIIENVMDEQTVPDKRALQEIEKEGNNNEDKTQNTKYLTEQSDSIPVVNVRDQADVFKNRPALAKVDPTYHVAIRGASAVATRSDGAKFIGKIKLIKKEEEVPENDGIEETPQKHGPDYVVPDVVKERLGSYQEVILRNKENRSSEKSR